MKNRRDIKIIKIVTIVILSLALITSFASMLKKESSRIGTSAQLFDEMDSSSKITDRPTKKIVENAVEYKQEKGTNALQQNTNAGQMIPTIPTGAPFISLLSIGVGMVWIVSVFSIKKRQDANEDDPVITDVEEGQSE